jgi:glycosyltransferase involved in cell wall biosynthesis
MIKALHFVKTFDGAAWAAWQARELVKLGVEVHVAAPSLKGKNASLWLESGAQLHQFDASLGNCRPGRLSQFRSRLSKFMAAIAPNILHSHFFTTTVGLRIGLGRNYPIPRVFQIPGPLHLESFAFRKLDLATAGEHDYWAASSRYTRNLYRKYDVPEARLFLSYYGIESHTYARERSNSLREKLGLPADALIVGNINYLYPPKFFLGQTKGLKNHEEIIRALSLVCRERDNTYGVLVGGAWGGAIWYERYLKSLAARHGNGRIIMTGFAPLNEVRNWWADFDCAVHCPLSENCGGVIEPMLAGVPVVGAHVGGIPEVVIDGETGVLTPRAKPREIADSILRVLRDLPKHRRLTGIGGRLVSEMFDVSRSAQEIHIMYEHILNGHPIYPEYDSLERVKQLAS